jgi:hypothetical protein
MQCHITLHMPGHWICQCLRKGVIDTQTSAAVQAHLGVKVAGVHKRRIQQVVAMTAAPVRGSKPSIPESI